LLKNPIEFREFLQGLGPTFIKMGQFLALRPDLLPQPYCDEMMKLMDRVPPFPREEAESILREDLRTDPKDVFPWISPTPMAAGSIAQTYMARTNEGITVAIKIQRPKIRERVLKDLKRIRLIGQLLEFCGISRLVSPREVAAEVSMWLHQEIDFARELRNVERMHRLSVGRSIVKVPLAFPQWCSPRVLVLEFLEGVSVTRLFEQEGSSDFEFTERPGRAAVDRESFSRNLLASVLSQIFEDRFFHADLHPGNLIALPDGVVGFVDFGLCGELDELVHRRQFRYLSAIYHGDREGMYKAISEILVPGQDTDLEAFRRDFLSSISRESRDDSIADLSPSDLEPGRHPDIARLLVQVLRIARKHHLRVPPGILLMYRAVLGADLVARRLSVRANLRSTCRRFFQHRRLEEMLESLRAEELGSVFAAMVSLLRDSPGQLNQILTDIAEGTFNVNVESSESARSRQSRNQRAKLLATSIISVGLAFLSAHAASADSFGASREGLWLAMLVLIYIWFIVQILRL
jgi:ubiquinone biosynthesis protein